ncbi:MAG TPA: hypothetical protein VHV30_05535 [Polyangiaceae bacterium]|nr:hypothetical protein [Polyangiaceae bacterium]
MLWLLAMPITALPPPVLPATAAAAAAAPINRPDSADSPELNEPAKVRSGLVLGLSLGGGAFGASGYPNSSSEINDPRFYSASGLVGGTSDSLLVMGAISDYVNFGFWFGGNATDNGHWRSTAFGAGVRLEIFPLIAVYPRLKGLAFFGAFGIGGGDLKSEEPDPAPEAKGVQSFLGTGAFYEFDFGHFLGGHFGAGPSLEYDAVWSQAFERHGAVASARVVFYGGP